MWLPQDKWPVDVGLDDHCHLQSALLPIWVHCGNSFRPHLWHSCIQKNHRKSRISNSKCFHVSIQSRTYGSFFLCVFPPMRNTRVLPFLSKPNNITCPAHLPHPLPCHLSVRLWGNTAQPTSVCMHTAKVYVICLHIKHASYEGAWTSREWIMKVLVRLRQTWDHETLVASPRWKQRVPC